jgi:hypothetical protein
MNTWSFYSLLNGKFASFVFTGKEKHLALNTPNGYGALQGIFTSSQCVDLNNMQVVACQPDKPSDTDLLSFEWEETAGQWVGYPTLMAVSKRERAKRDQMLYSTDWTQLPDAPLTEQELHSWREYRQSLRNIPEQDGFPYLIEWPAAPTGSTL